MEQDHFLKNNLYGLILAGGKSTRMQKDKTVLMYHGRPQSHYCIELLQQFCDQVFLSCRKDQAQLKGYQGLQQIHDIAPFKDIGPLGGILSAMSQYPDRAWLVLAVDLPFVNRSTIDLLLTSRDPRKIATAYRSPHDGMPEPLCAIYESHAMSVLRDFYDRGIYCPRKILNHSDAILMTLPESTALDNVNTPQEYNDALKNLELNQ
ncbi:MAG: NTP transferase domain-containing protein [Candidatus Omnitrophota bacterium]|nr:NTP transferase domain-containing protein [Candidatus Omnitrophota bacterium]